ncbi:MAG TPA: tyrosine-protein phosphatase, partial [Acidimicrobiales bacterium]
WRTLYRADGIYRLSWNHVDVADDLEVVRSLDLRTVVDLRTDRELEERGRFPADELGVRWHHISVMDLTWDRDDPRLAGSISDFLTAQYLEMLDHAVERFARALRVLALPGALPGLFHCAAGKDRTGLLAALILGALGVPDDVVTADYALTADAMDRMRAWAEIVSPEWAASFRDQPAAHMAAVPEAMAGVLRALRAEHGTIRDYVRAIGVPESALLDLEAALLD